MAGNYLQSFRALCNKYDYSVWVEFVKETNDKQLFHLLPEMTEVERIYVGYYALATGRLNLIKVWGNDPRFSNDLLANVLLKYNATPAIWGSLLAMYKYMLNCVEGVQPFKALLVVIKTKMFRDMYPQMLASTISADLREWRRFLVRIASGIANGTELLVQEWKKYPYNISEVWGEVYTKAVCVHELELHLMEAKGKYTPFLQVCRYGSRNDLKFFLRNPELCKNPNQLGWPMAMDSKLLCPLGAAALNADTRTLRYLLYTYTTIKRVLALFPHEIAKMIWSFTIYRDIFTQDAIFTAKCNLNYKETNQHDLQVFRLLRRAFPGYVIPGGILASPTCTKDPPKELKASVYNCFTKSNPVHPRPEELIWATSHKVFCSPKADGTTFKGFLDDVFPLGMNCNIKAEKIVLNDRRILYLVFDVHVEGNWLERIEIVKDYHYTHFSGPYYQDLGGENAALRRFLAKTKDLNKIWWPKGVYPGGSQLNLLCLLDNPPVTPYPNDGWIIATDEGVLYKVKPKEQLTIDIQVAICDEQSIWQRWPPYYSDFSPEAVLQMPQDASLRPGIWRCVWNPMIGKWEPREMRHDKKHPNGTAIIEFLTEQHRYPWRPLQLIPWINKERYYYASSPRITTEMRPILQKQRELEQKFEKRVKSGTSCIYVINIGCGYQFDTDGLDIDPYAVATTRSKHVGYSRDWIDTLTMKNPVTGQPYGSIGPATHCCAKMIYSIHYLADSRAHFECFMKNIQERYKYLFIAFVDGTEIGEQHLFSDGSEITRVADGWHPEMCWVESKLLWNSSRVRREPMITMAFLEEFLAAFGYQEFVGARGELCTKYTFWEKI